MLVVVILERLGEAHGWGSGLVKRIVVAAAAVAIHAENHADGGRPVGLLDSPRQFPGSRIRIVGFAVAGKEADTVRRSRSEVGADDVVVEHAPDDVALLSDPLQHVRRTEQTLLFAGDGRENERRAEAPVRLPVAAEQTGAFEADCYARGVVIGTGGIELGIHDVLETWHGVEVARNDKNGLGKSGIPAG